MKGPLWVISLSAAVVFGCSGSPKVSSPASPTPGKAASVKASPTPVRSELQRANPDIVEDTPTYIVERFKKSDYIRVDATHIRHPIVARPVEIYKEDDQYYYVYTAKVPKDAGAAVQASPQPLTHQPSDAPMPSAPGADYGMPPEDFEDIVPARVSAAFRLEAVPSTGLPSEGMWRSSFAIADINGDGKPDIVSPPARLGGAPTLHVWPGDGHGGFTPLQVIVTENGKPKRDFSADYGGVAVGDIDGDGKLDVVMASHSGGLWALFGEGEGRFSLSHQGLPGREFSTQAVALVDLNGDGKLDIVASQDTYEIGTSQWDPHQVRVYLADGVRGWKYAPDALINGAWSNSVTAWDYNRDGRLDILTGSQAYGAVQLLFKNAGNGQFETGYFPQIEIHGFHFAMAPGTFGKDRLAAFADGFVRSTNVPTRMEAQGITVYSYKDGAWTRHRVWRKKEGKSSLYAIAMGDLDGDGLDDVVFADSTGTYRLRIFLQQKDGTFKEADEKQEPVLDSPGQCIRLADLDGDGRLDVIVSKTYGSGGQHDPGGWSVFLNRK